MWDDIELREKRVYNGTYIYLREEYIKNRKRGDNSIVVEDWDAFQKEREEKTRQKKLSEKYEKIMKESVQDTQMEDMSNMKERYVLIRLSKYYNNAEVGVTGIESKQDFQDEKDWAKNECFAIINQFPNHQLTESPITVKATPKEYVEAYQESKTPSDGVYLEKHLTTKFLKGGQILVALKGLNEGKYTLEQVNGLQSWQEQQDLIFPKKR